MPPQSNQQQGSDNSAAILWGLGLIFVVMGLLWLFFHEQITRFILQIRLLEARLLSVFVAELKPLVAHLQSLSPAAVTFNELSHLSAAVGRYLRYPVAAILLLLTALIYTGRATLRFKRHYSINALVEAEQVNWPQITPIVSLNLVEANIDQGPWAMALSPLQFAKKHQLMQLERIVPSVSTSTLGTNGHYFVAKLKPEAARATFITQLGPYWQGIETLSLPTKALFAIFAAQAARDREAANQLLAQIIRSTVGDQAHNPTTFIHRLNFTGAEALLKKHVQHKLILQLTQKHAYLLTVMASLLQIARQDGVLASSEFLWLKPADRRLWFMLNSVGRQTAFPEVAGPFAHWLAERAIGQKLLVPMIDSAVSALDTALKEVRLSEATLESSGI